MELLVTKSLAGRALPRRAAFTLVEIALSLAIIGVGLVAIIGVLPLGMKMQSANREQTIINQDATVFMETIRNGMRGADDLTNYVYAITNYWVQFNNGTAGKTQINGYSYTASSVAPGYYCSSGVPINSGERIVGLLSTPEFVDANGNLIPSPAFAATCYSNHIVAYVRSLSGPAVEKPPQANDSLIREASFGYRLVCVNSPLAADTNALNSAFEANLLANLRELRLFFAWPLYPNGGIGPGKQTFRTLVAGQMTMTNDNNQALYLYQPQIFTNAP